jgi:tetratricopeptide (TPR) repeat protein
VQKGLAKADSGSSDDALAVARKVLRIRSDHPQAIALQALALAMQGRYDESLKSHEAYARIVHGRDSEKEARNAIEASYASYRLGRDDDVMRWLRMAQYANPEVTYVRLLEPGLGPLREKARRLSPWDDAYS